MSSCSTHAEREAVRHRAATVPSAGRGEVSTLQERATLAGPVPASRQSTEHRQCAHASVCEWTDEDEEGERGAARSGSTRATTSPRPCTSRCASPVLSRAPVHSLTCLPCRAEPQGESKHALLLRRVSSARRLAPPLGQRALHSLQRRASQADLCTTLALQIQGFKSYRDETAVDPFSSVLLSRPSLRVRSPARSRS